MRKNICILHDLKVVVLVDPLALQMVVVLAVHLVDLMVVSWVADSVASLADSMVVLSVVVMAALLVDVMVARMDASKVEYWVVG